MIPGTSHATSQSMAGRLAPVGDLRFTINEYQVGSPLPHNLWLVESQKMGKLGLSQELYHLIC